MRSGVQNQSGHDQFFSSGLSLKRLRTEVFFLAYHLHWSWSELMAMECDERAAFVDLLVEQIERENARIATARDGH